MADSFIPKIALDYIKNKNLKTGFSYKDVWNEEHAAGFTVAKAMQIDVLSDMKSAVEKAIEKGETFEQFKKNIKPTLIQKGWWGKKDMVDPLTGETVKAQLGSDRRLKTIYDTNIWSAYSKGSYDRAMESFFVKYFMYRIGYAQRHREQHVAWDGLVLPKDDAFWYTHYPPNGYGCHCYVTTLTEERKRRYEKEGFPTPRMQDGSGGVNMPIKTAAPKEEYTAYENLRKGTVERIPKGITPGFAWNQGDPRSSQTMRACMDKVRQKFPDKADELARYFANEKVTKDVIAQSGSTSNNVKVELPENFGKISNFKEMSYSQKLNAVCDWAIRKGLEQNCERFILLDKNNDVIAIQKAKGYKDEINDRLENILNTASPKSITLVHNHDNISSFSLDDIITVNNKISVRKILATCPDMSYYELSAPISNRLETRNLTTLYYNIAFDIFKRNGVFEMSEEEQDDAWISLSHEINEKLVKEIGWVYGRKHR